MKNLLPLLIITLCLASCEDKKDEEDELPVEAPYCSIVNYIAWTPYDDVVDYNIAWDVDDEDADYRMKWDAPGYHTGEKGYWRNVTGMNPKPPGTTYLRDVSLNREKADFIVRNTTGNNLPAGCK